MATALAPWHWQMAGRGWAEQRCFYICRDTHLSIRGARALPRMLSRYSPSLSFSLFNPLSHILRLFFLSLYTRRGRAFVKLFGLRYDINVYLCLYFWPYRYFFFYICTASSPSLPHAPLFFFLLLPTFLLDIAFENKGHSQPEETPNSIPQGGPKGQKGIHTVDVANASVRFLTRFPYCGDDVAHRRSPYKWGYVLTLS